MRTKTIECYEFKELSEEAQRKAIEHFSDINVDHDWWYVIYEDAEHTANIEITGFDIYHRDITGKMADSVENSIKKILKDHGPNCKTYKVAAEYKDKLDVIKVKFRLLTSDPDYDDAAYEEEVKELEEEYLKDMLNYYLKMLEEEYEYQTSEEAIKEAIIANEYEFDKEGNKI